MKCESWCFFCMNINCKISSGLNLSKRHSAVLFRHGNWKKCLGSTKPKWPESRGRLGPGGVQGQTPCWGVKGLSPLAENKFGYFGDQFVASQCTEIMKKKFFFFFEASKPTFHYFLQHTNQFFKLPTYKLLSDSQGHKMYYFPLEHFSIYTCMSHDLPDYQSWQFFQFSTKRYEQYINYEKAPWKCCACKHCNSIVSKHNLTVIRLTCVQL